MSKSSLTLLLGVLDTDHCKVFWKIPKTFTVLPWFSWTQSLRQGLGCNAECLIGKWSQGPGVREWESETENPKKPGKRCIYYWGWFCSQWGLDNIRAFREAYRTSWNFSPEVWDAEAFIQQFLSFLPPTHPS